MAQPNFTYGEKGAVSKNTRPGVLSTLDRHQSISIFSSRVILHSAFS